METPVFHLPLNDACTHYGDIVYNDESAFTRSDKKTLRDFIWNKLLDQSLALDETKEVEIDTSLGKVHIQLAVHPVWHRYKTVQGFIEQQALEVAALPLPATDTTVESSSIQADGLKTFTVILQFEAVRQEELEDRHVFYGVDGSISAFLMKNMGVSAIMAGKLADNQEKSYKKLLKNLLRNKR